MSDSDLPSTMVVCEYSAASPSGIRFTKRPPPITVSSPRPGLLGTALFASTGSLVVRVKACGVNPVDAKYIIGDKFPASWMGWCARRVSGHSLSDQHTSTQNMTTNFVRFTNISRNCSEIMF